MLVIKNILKFLPARLNTAILGRSSRYWPLYAVWTQRNHPGDSWPALNSPSLFAKECMMQRGSGIKIQHHLYTESFPIHCAIQLCNTVSTFIQEYLVFTIYRYLWKVNIYWLQNCFCLIHYEGQNYCKSTQIETAFRHGSHVWSKSIKNLIYSIQVSFNRRNP